MADVPVPSIITATPAGADTVLGIKAAALRRFAVTDIAAIGGRMVSVKDPQFGAVGDGVTDDTVAWQAFIDYLAANGGTGWVPHGDYAIVSPPLQLLSAAEPFVIQGESALGSRLVRMSTASGSMINWSGVNNFQIRDLGIDYNKATFPSSNPAVAGHGVAISNGNNVRLSRLHIKDQVNSAILVFHFPGLPPPATAQEVNNVVEDCYLDGNGDANNGVLLVDQYYSYIRGCTVVDLGNAGTPQSALQFKNRCYQSHISDCVAINARHGVAMGQEDVVGIAAEQCSVSNVTIRNCVWGLYLGSSAYCTFDNINIVKDGTGSHVIEMTDCVENSFTNIKARGQPVGSGAYSVKFGGASLDNYVEFSTLNIQDTIPEIALYEVNSLDNAVRVKKLKNTAVLSYSGQCANDQATVPGNSLEIDGYETQVLAEIVAGVITVKNPRAKIVRINTEGSAATDDLDSIIGSGRDGQRLLLKTVNNSRDVTLKAATGNLSLAGGADFTLSLLNDLAEVSYIAGITKWGEVGRSDNT